MKTALFLFLFCLLTNLSSDQYRKYKSDYNTKTYSYLPTDKYNPNLAAALAVLPGLGHFYVHEEIHGLLFLGGMGASLLLIASGSLENWAEGWDSDPHDGGKGKMVIGEIAFVSIYALNFFDVVHLAKVKNIHYRRIQSVSFRLHPIYERRTNGNFAGISLKIGI